MLIWRLIFEKIATLQELEMVWSLDDVLRANALLDLKFELNKENNKKAKR